MWRASEELWPLICKHSTVSGGSKWMWSDFCVSLQVHCADLSHLAGIKFGSERGSGCHHDVLLSSWTAISLALLYVFWLCLTGQSATNMSVKGFKRDGEEDKLVGAQLRVNLFPIKCKHVKSCLNHPPLPPPPFFVSPLTSIIFPAEQDQQVCWLISWWFDIALPQMNSNVNT